MRPLLQEITNAPTPEALVENLRGEPGVVLLRTSQFDLPSARYSLVTAQPFLTFRSFGSRCEITSPAAGPAPHLQFGNPWHLLEALMARYELLDEIDSPFPLGGAFGCWGYDLKNFTEPKLPRRAVNDLELPDCHVGFYHSLVVFDHRLGRGTVVATGLEADGSRSEERAQRQNEFWLAKLAASPPSADAHAKPEPFRPGFAEAGGERMVSNFTRADFLAAVARAQRYIRAGDIYQVNLSQRLSIKLPPEHAASALSEAAPPPRQDAAHEDARHAGFAAAWDLFQQLSAVSPAPFAAFLDGGDFQLASSSPEQFLNLSGAQMTTRPIKGTRPRDPDPTRDAQLAYELQTSTKELAELVMITDLLRNDLGRVCEYGSVQTPDLARLERFAQVQHLVSTVVGRLRPDVTHFAAFAACFPGGSITGAPKFRAMAIIDELEPVSRGPYCGAIGYLGFNRESQLNIAIRTAICRDGVAHFNVGAGIVADSDPAAEYDETLAKARGFIAAFEGVRADARRL